MNDEILPNSRKMAEMVQELKTLQFVPPDLPTLTPAIQTIAESNYASEFHRRLVEWINRYNDSLDDAHEVGAQLVSFGPAVVFRLTDVSYWNPWVHRDSFEAR